MIYYILRYSGNIYKIVPKDTALLLLKQRPAEIVGKYSAEHLNKCYLALKHSRLIP